MKLTLAPVPFNWPFEKMIKFYKEISKSAVDEVYIGESVCCKRGMLGREEFHKIASLQVISGKKVIASSLALVKNETEIDSLREMLMFGYPIEANNSALLNMTNAKTCPIIIGHSIPIYNRPTALLFAESAKRIVLSPELSGSSVENITSGVPLEKEIYVFGRLPLGNSWNCYTARHEGLENSTCGMICGNYPEGIDTRAISGESLWNINGTQVLSVKKLNLVKELERIEKMGITHVRIVPQLNEMNTVIDIFRRVMDGNLSPEQACSELEKIEKSNLCNGWFHNLPGMDYI